MCYSFRLSRSWPSQDSKEMEPDQRVSSPSLPHPMIWKFCESLLSPSTCRNRFPERFRLPASRENNTWPPVRELVSLPFKKLKIKSLLEIYSTTWKQFWVTTTKPKKLAEFSCRSNLIWTHLNVNLFLFFYFLVKTQRHQLPSQVKPTLYTGGSNGKESACSAGDLGSIPGSGRSPGEGNGNPLQYPCLENSTDRGSGWATAHGVAKSQTQLSNLLFHICQKNILPAALI